MRKDVKNGGNKAAAAIVGKRIADRAKALGIETVAFDRSGYRYHGRVQALADAAREAGPQVLTRRDGDRDKSSIMARMQQRSSSRTSAATACARR